MNEATPKTSLTPGEKQLVDVLIELMNARWVQFNERRQFEFKVTLAFWSALAAATAGSLTIDRFPEVAGGHFGLCLAAGAVVFLHVRWVVGLRRSQDEDKSIAFSYEKLVRGLIGATPMKSPERRFALKSYTHFVQVGVTLLLAICLIAVNWARLNESHSLHTRQLEELKLRLEIQRLQKDLHVQPVPPQQHIDARQPTPNKPTPNP